MLRISSAHFEDGCGDHPWASRFNPQGDVRKCCLSNGQIRRIKKTALGVDGKRQEWHNIVVEMMIEQRTKGMSGFDRDILEWSIPEEVLAVLLKDRSTGRNLIWATDEKENFTNGI